MNNLIAAGVYCWINNIKLQLLGKVKAIIVFIQIQHEHLLETQWLTH